MTLEFAEKARILLTGDSITRGNLGWSYVALLQTQFPKVEFVNLGQDGDTLSGIHRRTREFLSKDSQFDFVIIVAGHNDIILPTLTERGSFYRLIPQQLARQGSVPTRDLVHFDQTYRQFLNDIRRTFSGKLVISTLSFVNEHPLSPTAQLRLVYNHGIRKIARENDVQLADVGLVFDQYLQGVSGIDYFMKSLLAPVTADLWASRSAKALSAISRRRGLHLTIDGVHLNPRGAELYAETLAPLWGNIFAVPPA